MRLEVVVSDLGSLVDRRRTLDVTRVREGGAEALRIRFRAPASLIGRSLLLRREQGQELAWRFDRARQKVEPLAWPKGTQELGGTGLTWSDLWGPQPGEWRYRLEGEGDLALGESSDAQKVRVLRIRALGPGGVARLLHLEHKRRLPLLIDERRRGGERRLVWRSRWKESGEFWIPLRLRIQAARATSRIEVRSFRLQAPSAHLDPSRFMRE